MYETCITGGQRWFCLVAVEPTRRASYHATGIDQEPSDDCGEDAQDEKDPDDILGREDGLPGLQSLLSEGRVGGASAGLLLFDRRLLVRGILRRIHPDPAREGIPRTGCEDAIVREMLSRNSFGPELIKPG